MIKFVAGNLFDSNAEAIVNTVNCVGIMGRGVALQFKKQYPDNFKAYEIACKRGEVIPGKMFVFKMNQLMNCKYIINFPTKRHWRGASRIEDIETGLVDLAEVITKLHISSIALPPLGSGLGGLEWKVVRNRIETTFKTLTDVYIEIYTPNETVAAKQMTKNIEPPKMTPGRAALVSLIQRYLGGLLDPFVTLLEIHKLMYFLQECGQPLKLRFAKAPYGPFAENLSHVLKEIEGNLLSGYIDGGDKPDKQIEIVPGAEKDANVFLAQSMDTLARIDRVAKLVDGFETPFGMELLATVHWVAKNEAKTLPEIINCTHKWGEQKHKFSSRQIRLATEHLTNKKWITLLT
jgi:O-acetyl-ADP-ribose deacetylase (regulator of RNase III)